MYLDNWIAPNPELNISIITFISLLLAAHEFDSSWQQHPPRCQPLLRESILTVFSHALRVAPNSFPPHDACVAFNICLHSSRARHSAHQPLIVLPKHGPAFSFIRPAKIRASHVHDILNGSVWDDPNG